MEHNIDIFRQKLPVRFAQAQLRQTDIPFYDFDFLETRRILLPDPIEHRILQHLLQALLRGHAPLRAQQDLYGFDTIARPEQLLQQRFPQKTGSAGHENRRLVVEIPDVRSIRGLVVDDGVVVNVWWENPEVLVGVEIRDTHFIVCRVVESFYTDGFKINRSNLI